MNAKTILLAEDDDDAFTLMKFAFAKVGSQHTCRRVRDGLEAIQYLSGEGTFRDRQRYPFPSLLLLDLHMPGKDGIEVLRWVREQSAFNQLIVTILSSSNEENDIADAYDGHANSYLVKPATFEALTTMVRRIQEYWLESNTRAAMSQEHLNLAMSALN